MSYQPIQPLLYHDDKETETLAWNYKATIAYWTTCMTIEGAILFAIGSFMMYPGTKPTDEEHEYVARAWVEYPFFFGGWCFTFGNYLSYLQVINQNNGSGSSYHFLTWPRGQTDKGHVASLLNFVGALWYNVGTTTMFGWPPITPMSMYDLDYVATGVIGSLCFAVAAILQGEYNNWRSCTLSLPVMISHMNFWGSILFLVGYTVNTNMWASSFGADSLMVVGSIDCTFLFGSVFFLLGAWMDLIMWQKEQYGLGFAQKLQGYSEVRADAGQMLTIAAIVANMSLSWIRLAFAWSAEHDNCGGLGWSIAEKLISYHGILLLLSLLHKVPDTHPYDYLTYAMRFIAVFGIAGEIEGVTRLVASYSQ